MNVSSDNLPKIKCRSLVSPARLITSNMSLPNILSLSRIFCVPVIAFCVIHFHAYNNYRYVALFTMFGAGLSDLLDGYFARKRNETSRLGIYLDSIADKLLLIPVFILLSCDNLWPEPRFPDWLPAIVVAKEIVVTTGSIGITFYTGKTLRPTILGKVSTDLQICAIIAVFLGNHIPLNIISTFLWLAVIFTSVSMVHYIYIGLNQALKES